jgi:transcriptional regulator with XRE-family HTH domain
MKKLCNKEHVYFDVRSARKKLCITQEQLADACGLSLKTISNVENGATIANSSEKTLLNYFDKKGVKIGKRIFGKVDKHIFSNFIDTTLQYDADPQKLCNLSETQVIKNFCKTYGISYSTFIRWYKDKQNINARSKSTIKRAIEENFGRCICHKLENDTQVFHILTNLDNKISFEYDNQFVDFSSENLPSILENAISIAKKVGQAIDMSRSLHRGLQTIRYLEIYSQVLSACKGLKKLLDQHEFNLYVAKVPHYKIKQDLPNLQNNPVFLLLLSRKKYKKIRYLPNLGKVE